MSGDPEQEYFADGVVEDIITALSCFKSLFVIARNSSFTFKGKVVDIKKVGQELGVRYVLAELHPKEKPPLFDVHERSAATAAHRPRLRFVRIAAMPQLFTSCH
jgi:hypothetical protein